MLLVTKVSDDFFFPLDLETPAAILRGHRFQHRIGMPVIYYDIQSFAASSNHDLVEIHSSHKYLEVDLAQVLPKQLSIGQVVPAPGLFAGPHTLDLGSVDDDYRLNMIEGIFDISHDLRRYFRLLRLLHW